VTTTLAALFPDGINDLFDWKAIAFKGTIFEINKTAILAFVSTICCVFLFVWCTRKKAIVPGTPQSLAEMGYEFVEQQIAIPTIGEHHGAGKKWTPFLAVTFFFIFFLNIWSTFPGIYFPATSRIAIPMMLALITWVVYVAAGFKAQGPLYPIKTCAPSGVPKGILPIVFVIELFSKFIVRPFSLTVRLFANMVAGHVLLSVFAIMTAELLKAESGPIQYLFAPLPFAALVAFTGFELVVALLQAYIFAMLTGVFIGDSITLEH
jgi:F-type H+-transporting ATPase subunit a